MADAKAGQATSDIWALRAEFAPMVWALARGLGLRTATIGESDIAQEALLDIQHCPENVRNGSDGEKWFWIRTVVYRTALNMLRDQHCAKRGRSLTQPLEAGEYIASGGVSPAEELEHTEQVAVVRAAVDKLIPLQRLVVHLHYFERMSQERIAALLNIRQQSVATALKRGKSSLRELLRE
jgi:RNA polymerase sigma factor (sigma-70 family)